jgi:histidinol-phosphate aminotransferase
LALGALQPESLAQTQGHVETIRKERGRLSAALAALPAVRRVYPSQGNFLLVRCEDAETSFRALLGAGVVVRDQRTAPQLADALRISIGTPEENDRVIAALRLAGAPLRRDFGSGEMMSRPRGAPAGEAA